MAHNFPMWIYDHIPLRKQSQLECETQHPTTNVFTDITKVPQADGKLRTLQQTEILLLKLFKAFCLRNNFDYFLAYGTLIGAIRHKGFVPWDDDLDIFVFADQYDAIKAALIEEFKNTRFELWGVEKCRFGDASLRISHKDLPVLNLDLFYLFPSSLELPISLDVVSKIERFRKKYIFNLRYDIIRRNGKQLLDKFQHDSDAQYSQIIKACERSVAKAYFPNPFCNHIALPANTVFPLRETIFEGDSFPIPNNAKEHLSIRYGDWMSFPSSLDHHGDQFLNFNEKDAFRMMEHLQKCLDAGRFI